MKVTERDKKLLSFLGVIVIAALCWLLVITPLQEKIEERTNQKENLEMLKQEMDMKIAQKPGLLGIIGSLRSEAADSVKEYPDELQNQEVDRLFTNLALSHGLESLSLQVSMPSSCLTTQYYPGSTAAQEDSQELERVLVPKVQMKLRGTHTALMSFLDNVTNDRTDIQVLSVVFDTDEQQSQTNVTIPAGASETISISMALYTFDKDTELDQNAAGSVSESAAETASQN